MHDNCHRRGGVVVAVRDSLVLTCLVCIMDFIPSIIWIRQNKLIYFKVMLTVSLIFQCIFTLTSELYRSNWFLLSMTNEVILNLKLNTEQLNNKKENCQKHYLFKCLIKNAWNRRNSQQKKKTFWKINK